MSNEITLGPLRTKENVSSQSPTKEMRKLRVELSDRVFEIRKMEEDYAEQKAHIQMAHTAEKNTLNATIMELRNKITEENEHWTQKVDTIREDHQKQIAAINSEWEAKISKQVNHLTAGVSSQYAKEVAELRNTITQLEASVKANKKKYDSQIYCCQQNYKHEIDKLKQLKEKELEELRKILGRDEELKINAIMHIKNSEEAAHKITKETLKRKEDELSRLQDKHENVTFQLNQEIWSLKKQMDTMRQIKELSEQKVSNLENQKIEAVQMSQAEFQQTIKAIESDWKANLEKLNEKWMSEYKKLQNSLERSQQAMAEKQRLWEERGNKMFQLYSKRQARQEDVKLIESLEVQLIRKEFELEREKQELKCCKMELDNMDDIYKRIFYSASKSNRHNTSFHLKKVKLPGILNRSSHPLKSTIDQ